MTGHGRAEALRWIFYRVGGGRWLVGQAHGLLAAAAFRRPPLPGGGSRRGPGPGAGRDAESYAPARGGTASLRLAPRARRTLGPALGRVRGRRHGHRARGGLLRREAAAPARAAGWPGAGSLGGGLRNGAGAVCPRPARGTTRHGSTGRHGGPARIARRPRSEAQK